MRTKWVLVGYGILYLAVALSFVPMDRLGSPALAEAWEMFAGIIWGVMTVAAIGLLEIMSPLAMPLARAVGGRPGPIEEGLLAAICLAVALFAIVQLVRKDTTPGRRGLAAFLLLLAVSVVALVRFTLASWAHFG